MRRNGQKPQPVEIRRLNGNPSKRPMPTPPAVEYPEQMPPIPLLLGQPGRDAWVLYWTHGHNWLAYTDIPTVTRLCKLIDRAALTEARIDEEGFLVKNPRTKRSAFHHTFNSLLAIYKAIDHLEAACGFTPADRSRLKADPSTGDSLDAWTKRKTPTPAADQTGS